MPVKPGYIERPAGTEPRPLTGQEAQEVFEAMMAKGDQIAFQYLHEGCDCRSQLIMEHMETLGINSRPRVGRLRGQTVACPRPGQPEEDNQMG
jgi:hypothetical protein